MSGFDHEKGLDSTRAKSENTIKDRLIHTAFDNALAQQVKHLPRPLAIGMGGFFSIVFVLMTLSYSIGNVLYQPEVHTVAFAKPAAISRTIRQTDVAQFGLKVSGAFGIEGVVAHEFADWIIEASERQQIAPELLASLVITESSFRKRARSSVGAIGPTQVRPDYWGSFCGNADLHDPEENIYCGAQVLSHMLERCGGDKNCALSAYNVGPYARGQNGAARRYVSKIDRYLSHLENHTL